MKRKTDQTRRRWWCLPRNYLVTRSYTHAHTRARRFSSIVAGARVFMCCNNVCCIIRARHPTPPGATVFIVSMRRRTVHPLPFATTVDHDDDNNNDNATCTARKRVVKPLVGCVRISCTCLSPDVCRVCGSRRGTTTRKFREIRFGRTRKTRVLPTRATPPAVATAPPNRPTWWQWRTNTGAPARTTGLAVFSDVVFQYVYAPYTRALYACAVFSGKPVARPSVFGDPAKTKRTFDLRLAVRVQRFTSRRSHVVRTHRIRQSDTTGNRISFNNSRVPVNSAERTGTRPGAATILRVRVTQWNTVGFTAPRALLSPRPARKRTLLFPPESYYPITRVVLLYTYRARFIERPHKRTTLLSETERIFASGRASSPFRCFTTVLYGRRARARVPDRLTDSVIGFVSLSRRELDSRFNVVFVALSRDCRIRADPSRYRLLPDALHSTSRVRVPSATCQWPLSV